MARIKVIGYEEAEGRLKEIYDGLLKSRGKLADVHTIQSLRPESIVKHIDLYMEIMFSRSELSRPDREMIAVVVSASNKCEYCQTHHANALQHYWKDGEKVSLLRKNYKQVSLNEKQKALCDFAHILTVNPSGAYENDYTKILKKEGLSDNAILDATLVVSYFNFVNRIVHSLGVALEEDSGKGYKY